MMEYCIVIIVAVFIGGFVVPMIMNYFFDKRNK